MPAKARIHRDLNPNNADQRAYFTRTDLGPLETAARGERTRNTLLREVLTWDGVSLAQVIPYGIAILKAPTYEWDEIEPKVLRLLASFEIGEGNLEGE